MNSINQQELYENLLEEVNRGTVFSFESNDGLLIAFNYTPDCQFKKLWNDINLQARGIVFEKATGKLIARPFKKFFNIEEEKDLSNEVIETITYKEDGSLIIVFGYNKKLYTTTRGSFNSEQSKIAYNLLQTNQKVVERIIDDENSYTWLFELVGPSNLNVCRTAYPEDKLILLGINCNQYDIEVINCVVRDISCEYGVEVVHEYDFNTRFKEFNELYKLVTENNDPNFEGIVIQYESGKRVKIKSELYKKLHKVITGEFTKKRSLDLWLSSKEGEELSTLINNVPDEFFKELKDKINIIEFEFQNHFKKSYGIYIDMYMQKAKGASRKDLALNNKDNVHFLPILFDHTYDVNDFYLFCVDTFCKSFLEKENERL